MAALMTAPLTGASDQVAGNASAAASAIAATGTRTSGEACQPPTAAATTATVGGPSSCPVCEACTTIPIVVERASAGAMRGMAVKIDAGTRPPTAEKATAPRYCSDGVDQRENTTSSAATITAMPLHISSRGVTP